jgi:hypothetical protein
MVQDRIFIEYDEGTGWVGIRKESRSGLSELDGFQLPPEFSPQDVRESLLATGSVTESTEGLVIVHQTSCQTLRQTVTEMLPYFQAAGQPTKQLLQIKRVVDEFLMARGFSLAVSLWTYAWLDLMVREDLADDARSVQDIWAINEMTLEVEGPRLRRLEEWMLRISEPAATRRMAASARVRESSLKDHGARDGTHG